MVKYEGIAYASPTTLTIIERRPRELASTFFTILYGAGPSELTYLSGLVMGVSPESSRDIYALRTCWRFLGRNVDIRACIRACGQYPLESGGISSYVRYCTQNDLQPGEETFSPSM